MYSGVHTSTLLEPSSFVCSRDLTTRTPQPMQFECPLCGMLCKQLQGQNVCHWLNSRFPLSTYKTSARRSSSKGGVFAESADTIHASGLLFLHTHQNSSCLSPGMGRMSPSSLRQKSCWKLPVVLHLANLSINTPVMRSWSGLRPLETLNSLSRSFEAGVPLRGCLSAQKGTMEVCGKL